MSVTVADVISWAREEVLDDNDSQKYLWSNTELVHHLVRALNRMFKIGMTKVDQTTEAIREIKLLSNLGVYALDSRIIQVKHARLESETINTNLNRTTESRLDNQVSDWRNETGTPREYCPGAYSGYLSIYPKYDDTGEILGASNITFATTKIISQVGGDFSDLAVGDEIDVDGTTSNDGVKTVATAGTTSIVVSETLVNESNTSAIIRKVRETLLMTVNRLANARYTLADIVALTVIEGLRDDHIDGLVDGIAQYAFLKPDTYTYYPQKAAYHKNEFKEFLVEVKRDIILLNKPDRSRVPRSGSSIYY